MRTGTVKFFNEAKGFGFIVADDDKSELFVHHSGLTDKVREGDKVEFEVMQGKRGLNAINVRKVR
jgi:cold shock protein